MAVAFDRKVAETADGTSGIQILLSGAGDFTAGEFVVCWVACDNAAGTDQPSIASVTYRDVSQTYSVVVEHGSSSTSAGGATRGFIIVIPSIDVSGGVLSGLTVEFSGSVNKCVGLAAVFTGVSDTVLQTTNSTDINIGVSLGATTPGSLTLSLWSWEDNAGSSGGGTAPGGDGQVFTTGGGAGGNVSMFASYSLRTSGSSILLSPPTMSNDGGMCSVTLDAAASGTTLVVADGAHAHAAESPTLTQIHNVTIADARSTHAADNVSVSQNSNVAVNDSTHAHTADQVAVTKVSNLVVADGSHTHAADNVVVTQRHIVTVADGLHAHAAESPTLTQVHNVAISDGAHGHAADNVALSGGSTVAVNDGAHTHTADAVALTQVHQLVVADGLHAHAADEVAVTENSGTATDLVIAEARHLHPADEVVLTQNILLVVHDTIHAHAADPLPLSRNLLLASTPPRQRGVVARRRPFNLMDMPEGVTWYRMGSDWFQGNYIDDDEQLNADELYRGGYEYEVTVEKAAELEALGFRIRQETR